MTPQEQMKQWDEEGTSYYISHLIIGNRPVKASQIDVISHNKEWLLGRCNDCEMWVNMAHVSSIAFETQ